MSNNRYYVDTQGNDDQAYIEAMQKASDIAKEDTEIKKVILLVNTKSNTGWFERILGAAAVKKLFTGIRITGFIPLYKLETKITFKDDYQHQYVVITCGWDSKEVAKIDDYGCAKYIIAIPWSQGALTDWVKTWQATELRGKAVQAHAELSCVVKTALSRLTSAVNLSSGITHPSDVQLTKTYLLALHTYETPLDEAAIKGFLATDLGWESEEIDMITGFIRTLKSGKPLRGANKAEIDYFYDQWKKGCDDNSSSKF